MSAFKLTWKSVVIVATVAIFAGLAFQAIPASAISLAVTPPIEEFTIDPGNSIEKEIKVTSYADEAQQVYVYVQDFEVTDEVGGITFLPPDEEGDTYSLGKWVGLSRTQLVLDPKQSEVIKVTIDVPENAEAGGHYTSVMFSTKPPEVVEGGVGIGGNLAAVFMVTVSGDVVKTGQLVEFATDKKFYTKPPVNMFARFENTGNVHFKPVGEVTISSSFGNAEKGKISLNAEERSVLPGLTRRFEREWSPGGILLGKYTADLIATYKGDETFSDTIEFWVIPLWFIILSLTIIVLLVAWIVIAKRKKKKTQEAQKQ